MVKAESRNLSFFYGDFCALKHISMPVHEHKVTALIGPSGCGKSTFLRCFNRMHDLYPGNRYEGEILLQPDNANLLASGVDPIEVRMRIGMVFQKPNPFPKSVFENVAYGLRVRGEGSRRRLEEKVEQALRTIFPAGSSSACASPAPSPPIQSCCCSTSRLRRSTRSPRLRSRS
jgi:phosphate transport system ATP-binding protein